MTTLECHLEARTINIVQELIALNIDSAEGYAQAGHVVEHPPLRRMLNAESALRSRFVHELSDVVAAAGEEPAPTGTMAGLIHRWWLNIRTALGDGGDAWVLSEAERGEQTVLRRYEQILAAGIEPPAAEVLRRQRNSIRWMCERLKSLREGALVH